MGKTLEDAGMLVKDENGNYKVSEATARKFLKVRNSIIDTGEVGFPFPCIKVDNKKNIAIKIQYEEKEKYPDFFKKWIDTILLNQLLNNNSESNISLPVYDPTAMGAKLGISPIPNLSLPELLICLAVPPGSPIPLLFLGIPPVDLPDILPKVPGVILPPIPPVPSLPQLPDINFSPINFSLLGKLQALNLEIPNIFKNLIASITLDFLAKFTINGLLELSCKINSNNSPQSPSDNDVGSYEINAAAISAITAEATAINVIGVVIGSSDTGIVAQIGAQQEHRDPPPPPADKGYIVNLDETKKSGIWTPQIPTKISSFNVGQSIHNVASQYAEKAVSDHNKSSKKLLWTNLHKQIGIGIASTESGLGTTGTIAKPPVNNWVGVQCRYDKANDKWVPVGNGTGCTSVGTESLTGGTQKVSYTIFKNAADSIAYAINHVTSTGYAYNWKTQKSLIDKLNRGVDPKLCIPTGASAPSVACYFLANGPADKEEPGPDDDRATFYRIFYAMRRRPLYYQGNADKTFKKYGKDAKESEIHPDKNEVTFLALTEVVEEYANLALSGLQTTLYYTKEPWSMPIGTFNDAHIWWMTRLGSTAT